jgi:hypothetical protein
VALPVAAPLVEAKEKRVVSNPSSVGVIVRQSLPHLLAVVALTASACREECAGNPAPPQLIGTVQVPGNALDAFDVSWVDSATGIYYLADRGNAGVEVVDAARGEFLRRIEGFAGDADHDHSGPNGVLVIPERNELWAGDGDSAVKVVDLASGDMVSVSTGGNARADELSYDPVDHTILVVNNAEASDVPNTGYFATLISTNADRRIIARIPFEQATLGLEQSVWDPATGMFYLAIPELEGDPARGAIAVIDPVTASIVDTFPVSECAPAGLALGPGGQMLLGCSGDAIEAGFPAKSVIMNVNGGSIAHEIGEVGGSDEVWFDPGNMLYYLAARDNPSGPALGIIEATSGRYRTSITTAPDAKSVAADSRSGRVLVALTPTTAGFANDPEHGIHCENGCIGIFSNIEACSNE